MTRAQDLARALVSHGWERVTMPFPSVDEHEAVKPSGPWSVRPEAFCGCGSGAFWQDKDGSWWCVTCRQPKLVEVCGDGRWDSQCPSRRFYAVRTLNDEGVYEEAGYSRCEDCNATRLTEALGWRVLWEPAAGCPT